VRSHTCGNVMEFLLKRKEKCLQVNAVQCYLFRHLFHMGFLRMEPEPSQSQGFLAIPHLRQDLLKIWCCAVLSWAVFVQDLQYHSSPTTLLLCITKNNEPIIYYISRFYYQVPCLCSYNPLTINKPLFLWRSANNSAFAWKEQRD
jgi:hypothetical protein